MEQHQRRLADEARAEELRVVRAEIAQVEKELLDQIADLEEQELVQLAEHAAQRAAAEDMIHGFCAPTFAMAGLTTGAALREVQTPREECKHDDDGGKAVEILVAAALAVARARERASEGIPDSPPASLRPAAKPRMRGWVDVPEESLQAAPVEEAVDKLRGAQLQSTLKSIELMELRQLRSQQARKRRAEREQSSPPRCATKRDSKRHCVRKLTLPPPAIRDNACFASMLAMAAPVCMEEEKVVEEEEWEEFDVIEYA
jgi:DNA-binding protein H-NS